MLKNTVVLHHPQSEGAAVFANQLATELSHRGVEASVHDAWAKLPDGAIERELKMSATLRSERVPGAVSKVMDVGPDGTKFAKPVWLRFHLKAGDLLTSLSLRRL